MRNILSVLEHSATMEVSGKTSDGSVVRKEVSTLSSMQGLLLCTRSGHWSFALCLWQDALLAEGAVQELVACIVRAADRPVAEYAASALFVLSHNHPGAWLSRTLVA